jgi:NSS family neurotransmitter:Na+ symporter
MTQKREHWGSKLGFILAAAGSAIGLGTMWMLPYVVGQNGGGAFVLVFFGFILTIGIPLFICELLLGRQAQRGVVGTFAKFTHNDSKWRVIGWLGVVCTYLVAGWYAVVAGWGLNYIWMSLTNAFSGQSIEQVSGAFETFRESGPLNVLWQFIFLVMTAAIVLRGLSKGIEKYAKILTSALFVILVGLAIYSATLPGFKQAFDYILAPDFSALTSNGVLKALSLALFTLSLGEGIMITYGSYMSKGDDIPKTSSIVAIAIVGISILVSLMIFPMVFTLGLAPESGEGLIFKTLPYVFEMLPGSAIIAVIFFSLLVFAAITSSVAQIEVMVANHMDLNRWTRRKSVLVVCAIAFLIGLPTALENSSYSPFHWYGIFNHTFLEMNYIVIDWMLCIFGFATAIFVGWVMPRPAREEGFKSGSTLGAFYGAWLFVVRFIVPAAILLVILNQAKLFGE